MEREDTTEVVDIEALNADIARIVARQQELRTAIDAIVAAPALLLPFGTRALRAGLASAFVTGACGVVAFDLALAFVTLGLAQTKSSRKLLAAVAAVVVLSALSSPPWQIEGSAPGGAVTGAFLVLFVLRIAREDRLHALLAFALGLALSYEPMLGFSAIAGAVVLGAKWPPRESVARSAIAFALGLLPLAFGFLLSRRSPELVLDVPLFSFVERGDALSPRAFAREEIGIVLGLAIVAGAVLAFLARPARRALLGLLAVVLVGLLAIMLRMPAGTSRVAAPILAALVAAHVIAAVALGAAVIAISRAKVPFAEASAALVVVLELVLPVRALDDTATRRESRAPRAAPIWNDIAWEGAPPGALLLVSDRTTMRRITAANATGEMRADLLVVPSFDLHGRLATRALVQEPKLAPLYRDVALGLPPEELSFGEISTQRAVLVTFHPKWDRALARHLVPVGLTARFEPEPRGASDRKKALDAFAPAKDRLVRVTVARRDPELAAVTAKLLRARAIAMAATGEKEMLARALDDLRAFAPDDPVGTTLVRRTVTTKGPIDVRDLQL